MKDREGYVRETIASVRAQTYPDWECVVVDDGSRDRSREVVQAAAAEDHRIRGVDRAAFRHWPGAPGCRNVAAAQSRGDLLIYLDSDDLLSPGALQNRVEFLDRNPTMDFCVNQASLFRKEPGDLARCWNTWNASDDLDRFLKMDVPWQTAAVTWRRSFAGAVGPWDEHLPSWQDWDQHVRALCQSSHYEKIGVTDLHVRRHDTTIGIASLTVDHLRSHTRLVGKIWRLLESTNNLTESRRRAVAGLAFWLACRLGESGHQMEAIRFWWSCPARRALSSLLSWLALVPIVHFRPVRIRSWLQRRLDDRDPSVFQYGLAPLGCANQPSHV